MYEDDLERYMALESLKDIIKNRITLVNMFEKDINKLYIKKDFNFLEKLKYELLQDWLVESNLRISHLRDYYLKNGSSWQKDRLFVRLNNPNAQISAREDSRD
jgi:hypothetical protein